METKLDGDERTFSDVREELIAAYRLSLAAASEIPGNIPSLLSHAFSRHFRANMPSIRLENAEKKATSVDLEELQSKLSRITALKPEAQTLLDRARSILTDGPPLSMNVELDENMELPDALHTLLQGTLWAILMEAGANPDLEDELQKRQAYAHSACYQGHVL
ncbi:hypothetical protein J8273_1356 [Carpediemonas membranifera]|uniref:Uncharacterized protein n=1 Tax=Carpediemonas membranifera TaxID=201153 RepID=A0A8J6B2H5_9EUKA|nr:hypothetical protein J8273_1356 [Carpediemonas membranifera]|eukprot:KAG9397005.1 hypothetical protein J8273_1356 [Carpediemonas membranifera]